MKKSLITLCLLFFAQLHAVSIYSIKSERSDQYTRAVTNLGVICKSCVIYPYDCIHSIDDVLLKNKASVVKIFDLNFNFEIKIKVNKQSQYLTITISKTRLEPTGLVYEREVFNNKKNVGLPSTEIRVIIDNDKIFFKRKVDNQDLGSIAYKMLLQQKVRKISTAERSPGSQQS